MCPHRAVIFKKTKPERDWLIMCARDRVNMTVLPYNESWMYTVYSIYMLMTPIDCEKDFVKA